MSLPWFKCNPRDFRDGLIGLSVEERGVYATVLMLIYERGGAVPDDAAWLSAHLGCGRRLWTKHRAALIAKGKLFELTVDGVPSLMNKRAVDEIAEQKLLRDRLAAGGKRPRETEADHSKINDVEPAQHQPSTSPAPAIGGENIEEEIKKKTPRKPPRGGEVRQAFDLWNELAERCGLPLALDLTDRRKRALAARLNDAGMTGWKLALDAVAKSAFCRGQREGSDGRHFRADLDFVCQPKSFQRLREGYYGADAKGGSTSAAPRAPWPGPKEIRDAVLAEPTGARLVSFLDGCGWRNGPERAITSSNGFVIDELRKGANHVFKRYDATPLLEKRQ